MNPITTKEKEKKKTKKYKLKGHPDFDFIEGTSGVILDGVWVKKDGSELIIQSSFWDKTLHFRRLKEGEKSINQIDGKFENYLI
jgi:hypothetical protein